MKNPDEWDVTLTTIVPQKGRRPALAFRFPQPLSDAMIAKGFKRASVSITDAGILIVPHVSRDTVSLPNWEGK